MSLFPSLADLSRRSALVLGACVGAVFGSSVTPLLTWAWSSPATSPDDRAFLWLVMALVGIVHGALVGAVALSLRAAAWRRTPRPVRQDAHTPPSAVLQVPVSPRWLPPLVACGMSGGVLAHLVSQLVWWRAQQALPLAPAALRHAWLLSAAGTLAALAATLGTWGAVRVLGRLATAPGLTGRPSVATTVLAVLAGLLGYAGGETVGAGYLVLVGVHPEGMLAFVGMPLFGCLVGSLLYDAVHGVRLLRTVGVPPQG